MISNGKDRQVNSFRIKINARHERDQSFSVPVPVRKKISSRSRREKNFGPGSGRKKFQVSVPVPAAPAPGPLCPSLINAYEVSQTVRFENNSNRCHPCQTLHFSRYLWISEFISIMYWKHYRKKKSLFEEFFIVVQQRWRLFRGVSKAT